jgi:hypothetical protein
MFASNIKFNGSYLRGAELVVPNPIGTNGKSDGNHLLHAKLIVADPIDIPVATIYSLKIHGDIDLDLHIKLRQKVMAKSRKSKDSNLLILQNTTSGIFYTFFSGIIPQKSLLLDEIDTLKVLECNEFRNHFVQLRENLKNIKRKEIKRIEETVKNYLQKIDRYIAFLKEKFDGINQQNIQKLHDQFTILQNELFDGTSRIHGQELLSLLEKINHLQLNLPANSPFNAFRELFHPEMLLLYAMEKSITISGFNFATLKRQDPLNICSYSDMCLPCETLLAWFTNTTEREGKRLIVSSATPSKYPTRLPNSQFPQYVFLPSFIKIALRETEL